jgi:hypothetical protein
MSGAEKYQSSGVLPSGRFTRMNHVRTGKNWRIIKSSSIVKSEDDFLTEQQLNYQSLVLFMVGLLEITQIIIMKTRYIKIFVVIPKPKPV